MLTPPKKYGSLKAESSKGSQPAHQLPDRLISELEGYLQDFGKTRKECAYSREHSRKNLKPRAAGLTLRRFFIRLSFHLIPPDIFIILYFLYYVNTFYKKLPIMAGLWPLGKDINVLSWENYDELRKKSSFHHAFGENLQFLL